MCPYDRREKENETGCGSVLVDFTKPHLNTETNQQKVKDLEV